jgi:tetratricopeptide (TPR) repeat protein
MNKRLFVAVGLLVALGAGLAVQRVWLAAEQKKATELPPSGPTKLAEGGEWQGYPDYLAGATILANDEPSSPIVRHTATKDGVLLLAASFTYDAVHDDDPWTPECKTAAQLRQDGWIPIGKMNRADGERHYIFRREVHAGEKLGVQTQMRSHGYFLTVPDADVAAVNAARPLVAENCKTLLAAGLPDELPAAQRRSAAPGTVAVQSPEPDHPFGKDTRLWPALREIVRQSVLLTARDELALPTSDGSLWQLAASTDDEAPQPLEVVMISQPRNEILLGIFRRQGNRWETLFDDAERFPRGELYEKVTTIVEAQSRKEYLTALKQAGFEGTPSAARDHADVPKEAVELSSQLFIPAQFGAIRLLHAEIRENGASPELVAALARSYSMLGVLTDKLWSPAAKVFHARAMLYAERAVNRWPQSALARYTRGYVRALFGLHLTAIADLDAAAKLGKENGAEPAPAWAKSIDAFCHFDSAALDTAAQDESQATFVCLLRVLVAECCSGETEMMASSKALYEAVPGCFRAIDSAAQIKQIGYYRYMAALGPEIAKRDLLRQVSLVPNLPEPVAKQIEDFQSSSKASMFSKLFSKVPTDEMATRLSVIEALREAAKTDKDKAEPSWDVLANLLDDLDFMFAYRQVYSTAKWLGLPADDVLDQVAAQVEHHPYGPFLETYRYDQTRAQDALEKLLETVEPGQLTWATDPIVQRIHQLRPQWTSDHFPTGLYYTDSVAPELVEIVRGSRDPKQTVVRLREVSPFMPASVMWGLNFELDNLRKQLPELEKKYSTSGPVLATIGQVYQHDNKTDDAIRCFETAIKHDPEQPIFLILADLYKNQGNEDKWLATLESFLKTENFGLGHAQVQVQIANHFIEKGDWKRARPYSEAAGQTWAGWALLKAGQCAEAMQDWDAAEQWYAALAQRYEPNASMWYEFCCRTGHGSKEAAFQFAMPYVDRRVEAGNTDDHFRVAMIYALAKQKPEAAALYEKIYRKTQTPFVGLFAALQFDEVGDIAARNRILDALRDRNKEDLGGTQPTYAQLAELLCGSKSEGATLAPPDANKLDELVQSAAQNEHLNIFYLAGWYLDRTGQQAAAIELWKRCACDKDNDPVACSQTLACAALRERGVSAAETSPPAAAPDKSDETPAKEASP